MFNSINEKYKGIKAFFTLEKRLKISLIYGYGIIIFFQLFAIIPSGSSYEVSDFFSVLFVGGFFISIRYLTFRPAKPVTAALSTWATIAIWDYIINRRGNDSGGGFMAAWMSICFAIIVALIKGVVIAYYLLIKETIWFIGLRKNRKVTQSAEV